MLCGATSKIKDCPANMKKRQGVLILEDRDRCVKAYREAGYEVWQTANGNF